MCNKAKQNWCLNCYSSSFRLRQKHTIQSKSWPLCLDWNVTLTPLLFFVTFIVAKHLLPHLIVDLGLLFSEAEKGNETEQLIYRLYFKHMLAQCQLECYVY